METLVHLVDETSTGRRIDALTLRLVGETVTVRELITRRVEAEVALHNAGKAKEEWHSLVAPTQVEQRLNGIRTRDRKRVDAVEQVKIALEAFRRNGFFVLVDDRQVESLDDTVPLHGTDTVSFLRLMPLVGG